jgi:hypothetical protein
MDIQPGKVYDVRYHGAYIKFRLTTVERRDGYTTRFGTCLSNATTRYCGVNLLTGRQIKLKSTQNILGEHNANL